jgi:hypothetical protein
VVTARAHRKRAELTAKLGGLSREFEIWTEATASGATLERHNSQMRSIVEALRVAVAPTTSEAGTDDDTLLRDWARIEEDLLAVHEIWDWFRAKFALRHVPEFEPYLRMADDFAYACYRPAQEHAAAVPPDGLRAPPLIFLGRVATPYALARGASFAADIHPSALTAGEFRTAVDSLPVPVIGVPWFQLRHLPDALVIGHEVGHQVAHDFQLDATVATLVDDALAAADVDNPRRAAWQGWLPEVFADVWGVLSGGPAFVGALADFVPTGADVTVGTADYPPAGVRVRLAAAVCPGPAADVALDRWRTDFGDSSEFEPDIPIVVSALLAGPYPAFGGAALTGVLSFGTRHNRVESHAEALLHGDPLDIGIDVRTLLPAAALAFARDPDSYAARNAHERVVAHARRIESRGLRAAPPETRSELHNRAAGATLAGLLAARRR